MKLRLLIALSLILATTANAADELAQANNPLANMQAFNIQNYYSPQISGFDQKGDTGWLRYAQPVDKFLVRASMPFTSYPVAPTVKKSGSGDFNVFAAYLIDTGNPSVSTGIGPLLVAPTAKPSELGSGKWQGGLAAVYFNANSNKVQYGGLVTYQTDFSGPQNRAHTSVMAVQPFGFLQLTHGFYLRSAPIWVFDFKNDNHVMPLSLGAGKVIKSGKTVYNLFIEPQFSVSTKGIAQPTTQIFAGFNMQFIK
ncbi:MAG: hypothetical protein P4L79_11720 [Legionella sp.]|uniref:hypothetical protein n=1 Tax=Legionella sp. TaxID=459 RepID=UPI00284CD513|nr:hypothetical protein [Legionella sp.]